MSEAYPSAERIDVGEPEDRGELRLADEGEGDTFDESDSSWGLLNTDYECTRQ